MLGTWRLDTKSENSMFMRQAIDPATARPVVQQACNSCRAKKLRCSGEKTGCGRCKKVSRPCEYAQPVAKGPARLKRSKSGKEAKDGLPKRKQGRPTTTPQTDPPSLKLSVEVDGSHAKLGSLPTPSLDLTMDLRDAGQTGGISPTLLQLDMADGAGKGCGAGPGSPCSIEQWLKFPSHSLDMDEDMDMSLWTNEGVDPTALSLVTPSATMTPALSPASTDHSVLLWPSNGMLPTPTDDGSPLSGSSDLSLSLGGASPGGSEPSFIKTRPRSSASSSANGSTPARPCQCLQQVVFLIDELESAQGESATQLDAGLAAHKKALRHGEAMVRCGHCTTRPENMTILTFLTDRLMGLCERIVASYREPVSSESRGGSPLTSGAAAMASSTTRAKTATPAATDGQGAMMPLGVYFGDYEIDCPGEWQALVRNLIVLQLRALGALMGRVKEVSELMPCDTAWRKVVGAETRLSALLGQVGGGGGGGGGVSWNSLG
ncbi:hypothetical protein B0T24DRAFT_304516 [Lasiosphaeria ovina]|uniref:Zn(2)-C6 fungal-type domain-containing protein n=1 Tax=Lasiosphaeria ovina TaxID=92902 RepID=A0AAE0K6Y3_9PEZI|nr:hypothetical protein B0T24DRAFT_304516 [Lasiosphaeria ovina]